MDRYIGITNYTKDYCFNLLTLLNYLPSTNNCCGFRLFWVDMNVYKKM